MNVSEAKVTMMVAAMNAANAVSCTAVQTRIVMLEVKSEFPRVSIRHRRDGAAGSKWPCVPARSRPKRSGKHDVILKAELFRGTARRHARLMPYLLLMRLEQF